MTLKEFVAGFMEANGLTNDVDAMIKTIEAEARKVQKGGCACLSEEDVEKIILGAELKAPEPKKEPAKEEPAKMEDIKKPHRTVKPEKKDESQLSIFELGVGLYD